MFNFLKGNQGSTGGGTNPAPNTQSSMAQKIISRTGQALTDAFATPNPLPTQENLEHQILETLIEENRTLKRDCEKQAAEMDEMRERVDTLKYLEEEASEENEILRFKVLSLEGQAALEGEQTPGEVKLIDELKLAKREMQGELEVLRTQVKSLKMLITQQSSQEDEEPQNPLIQIGQLKLLYDLYKIEISEEDLTRALASLYIKE